MKMSDCIFSIVLSVIAGLIFGFFITDIMNKQFNNVSNKQIEYCLDVCKYSVDKIYVDGDCVCATGK